MTPERFRQIRNLFEAVVERPPETRGTFLAEACEGDADLRVEVERLLAAHRRDTDLLAGPAIPPFGPCMLKSPTARLCGQQAIVLSLSNQQLV